MSFSKVLDFLLKAFESVMGVIANLAVIFFVGVYLAADPALYRDGLVRLFPPEARERTRDILNETGTTLWKWLLGRLLCMAVVGIGSGIVLAVLKIPLAPWLALLAAALAFIPNVGPAVSLAITTLVALPQGLSTAAWVVAAYFALELFESYLLTPLVQHKMVEIPPALLIFVQLIFGLLAGFLGLTVATPILAAAMVIVKRAYLEDTLGDPPGAPLGENSEE
jgi:predicted PurR-regulated permease PerM